MIDKRYGIRGRGRPSSPIGAQNEDEQDQNKKRQPRHITIELGGTTNSIDLQQPYNSNTTIIQNLEPYKGGYIPRYADETIVAETNNNIKPIACVKIGNYTVYPIRYLARNNPIPDWIYIAKRGNTAYLKIASNYIISVGLIGEIVSYNTSTQSLTVKTFGQLPHFYAWGGYIQVDRSLYSYSGYTIDENGIATLTNITPVSGATQTPSPLVANQAVWWVCSNIVENAPELQEFDITYDDSQTEWWWPIPTPIVYGYYNTTDKRIYALWDEPISILPVAITSIPPNVWPIAGRTGVWFGQRYAHFWAPNRNIYSYIFGGGGWAGLSIFDTAVPKWHRNPTCTHNNRGDPTLPPVPSSFQKRYHDQGDETFIHMAPFYIYEENFNNNTFSPTMPDWFRPYVKPNDTNYYVRSRDFDDENFRILNSLVRLYGRVLEGETVDIDKHGQSTAQRMYLGRLRYRGAIGSGNIFTSGYSISQILRHTSDYDFRCLRYPPRARIATPYAVYDNLNLSNASYHTLSYYEMTALPPYRSDASNTSRYELRDNLNRLLYPLLTPCWDVYSDSTDQIWCSRKGATPFVAFEDDPTFSYILFYGGRPFSALGSESAQGFHFKAQFLPAALSYGYKILRYSRSGNKIYIATRMIANGTPDQARIIIRNIDPRQYGNSTPFEVTNSTNNTTAATAVRNTIKDYYDNFFKTKIGKEDGSPLTNDYFPEEPFDRPKFTYRIDLSQHSEVLPNFSAIPSHYTHVDMLIPELHIHGCGEWDRSDLDKLVKFYAIKLKGSSNNLYMEELPSTDSLVPLQIVGYERITYEEKSAPLEVPQTRADNRIKRFRPLIRKATITNLRVRVPIPKDGSIYSGLEIRITPRWTQDTHDKGEVPPTPIPPCDFVDPAVSTINEYPVYTTMVLQAFSNTSNLPGKPPAKHWYAYLPLVPSLQREALIRTVSAAILHGETYGIQSVTLSKVDYGTKARIKVKIPNLTPSNNRVAKLWLLIGSVTASGQVLVHKQELTDADFGTTKTIEVPVSYLEGIGAPFYYSETKPTGNGEITSFANRLVHKATSTLQISAAIDGIAWHINPINELWGTSITLPDADLIMGNHTGKVFLANTRSTYMLYGENAFNLSLIPSETSVAPQPIFRKGTTEPVKITTNYVDGLWYVGEDGIYLGDDKMLSMPELMPENTLGIFLVAVTGNCYIIVEKKERYEIYMNDKSSAGFVLWTVDKQTPTNTPRLKHAEIVKGYLHLVAPEGLSISTPDAQVLALGKAQTQVPNNKTLYRTGALRIPEGLRIRKAKLQISHTTATHNTNVCRLKVYRRPEPTPDNLISDVTIQVAEPIRSRTVPITSNDHKPESITVELVWLHNDTAIKAIELIPVGGMNF